VVLEAVLRHAHALEDAADELRADRDIVLAAVRQDGWSLLFAAPELWDDREVVLEAVRQKPALFREMALDGFRADREVALEAVRQEGMLLKHAAEGLRADREVVLAAVRGRGLALTDAAEGLRADREVVLEAVRRDGLALQAAAEPLRADREVVLAAVTAEGNAVQYAAEALRGDREVMSVAVRSRGSAIQFARPPLRTNDGSLLLEANLGQGAWASGGAPAVPLHDIILSVRFSLGAACSPMATRAHRHVKEHEFFREAYRVYDPNLRSKGFCGHRREMTSRAWPCRGDCCASGLALLLHNGGRPCDSMCWRRSFMWHLRKARAHRGFMLQLEESDDKGVYCLGSGQEIEAEMADLSHTKVFRMRIGRLCTSEPEYAVEVEYTEQMMSMLIQAVRQWHLSDCQDMTLVELNEEAFLERGLFRP